ncbi:hypothetical protein IWX90DRAFT_98835 [Phyllosticta citrichinensis]|uniref:Uncharacterized protein n=1 Tax=Phyllosticta citrichinensis TaxID=1130410 RepID=A0ABR1Y1I5_9PEZI
MQGQMELNSQTIVQMDASKQASKQKMNRKSTEKTNRRAKTKSSHRGRPRIDGCGGYSVRKQHALLAKTNENETTIVRIVYDGSQAVDVTLNDRSLGAAVSISPSRYTVPFLRHPAAYTILTAWSTTDFPLFLGFLLACLVIFSPARASSLASSTGANVDETTIVQIRLAINTAPMFPFREQSSMVAVTLREQSHSAIFHAQSRAYNHLIQYN